MMAARIFFFQAEDGIRDDLVTGVQTCALPILPQWEVQSHRPTLIGFDGRTWRVSEKKLTAGKTHYVLEHWDPADRVIGRVIDYNAAYVRARDRKSVV